MTSPLLAFADFWADAGPKRWFRKDPAFDDACRAFEPAHHAAARRELDDRAVDARSALGLILLLDQLPRNIWRGSAHAYATDPLALLHARAAIAASHDASIEMPLRIFFYLPFEHAEFERYAVVHADVIARFGRFPHRNAELGRTTTPDEAAFLAGGGFRG
ncbi:DUF924 family protein [bacterium]|nr:DUF924 family protein [bacterium]